MIKNDQQYHITKTWAEKFAQSLLELQQEQAAGRPDLHPLLLKAMQDATQSQLADLESDLREYDALKAGHFDFARLNSIAAIPQLLIKARIARGWSQQELARRVGIKAEEIERHEAADYIDAPLLQIKEVAAVLSWNRAEPLCAPLPSSIAVDSTLAASPQP